MAVPSLPMIDDKRAKSFDSIATLYDAARPGYPQQLYVDVISLLDVADGASILDIGCGTGKSTLLFAQGHHCITALDPGHSMLEACRQTLRDFPDVHYVESTFEAWSPQKTHFDMIISGTAFHWVDDLQLDRTATMLEPHGGLAVFWHTYLRGPGNFSDDLDKIYRDFAPELHVEDIDAQLEKADREKEQVFANSSNLDEVRFLRYYRNHRYTTTQYCDLLRTFPTHRTLSDRFFQAVAEAIERVGGAVVKPIRTTCVVARKKTLD